MKSSNEMFNSLLERREQYIAEQRKKRKAAVRAVSSVCCLCLFALIGVIIWQTGLLRRQSDTPGDNTAPPASGEYAVYTDPVRLPENASSEAADMEGCLVYKGKVYVHTCGGLFSDFPNIGQLLGDYLGEANGSLDEWSKQEDWATEFASTDRGSVYKVNGYSEDFRLCIVIRNDFVSFFDNYDGIGLNTGADLFEERLHVTGNMKSVEYRPYFDRHEWSDYRDLTGVAEEEFDRFLTELCESPFVRIDPEKEPNIYKVETQGQLYLNMKDGTGIELTLYEGGYVGCSGLLWIFVKMPGELFDSVLGACQ